MTVPEKLEDIIADPPRKRGRPAKALLQARNARISAPIEGDDDLDGPLQTFRILNERQVCKLLGVSSSGLTKWISLGHFPAPIRMAGRRKGWRLGVLLQWQKTRPKTTSAEGK